MDFSTKIKQLCRERGITQKQLAKRLGITNVGLSKLIHQPYPQLQSLERIAKVLDVDVKELF